MFLGSGGSVFTDNNDGCGLGRVASGNWKDFYIDITIIVPSEPGMGAAEDNSRLSIHERKLA